MKSKVASLFAGLLVATSAYVGARAETQQVRAQSLRTDLTAVEPDPNDTKTYPLNSWSQRLPGQQRFELVFNGSGVLDRETGLVWERYIRTGTEGISVQEAMITCWNSTFGKRMGWRLPTAEEFMSLVEVGGRTGEEPGLPSGHPFKTDKGLDFRGGSGFWTASRFSSPYESGFREVVMQCGTDNGCGTMPVSSARAGSAWCVRGINNSN